MINVQNLTKRYKTKLVLSNLNFDIKPGIVTGFLGPNGAGKSTTMRCMVGIDKCEGITTFDGRKYTDLANPLREVGVMLDAKIFHPKRTALSHLQMFAAAAGVGQNRVDQIVDMVGLSSVIGQKTGSFSLGMAQRLSMAVALIGDPKYVVLDEPANGLDPDGIYWLRGVLKELASLGKVVFLSSHLLTEVSQLADQVILLGKCRILANMPIKELIEQNSTQHVFIKIVDPQIHFNKFAELVGHGNFVRENDGILITGVTTDAVAHFLSKNSIVPLEITNRETSLEEVYMRLTQSQVEFTPFAQPQVQTPYPQNNQQPQPPQDKFEGGGQ